MADKKFNIVITAFDNATAKIRKVNRTLADANRPMRELGKSMKNFSKEAGFSKLGKELGKTALEAGKVAREVRGIIAPLGAVVGLGSVGAVAAFSEQWAAAALNIQRTALYTGENVKAVSDLIGVNKLLGVQAETTSGTMVAFGQKMESALWGRDNSALAFFNSIGVRIGTTGGQIRQVMPVLEDFADKVMEMQKKNPAAAQAMIGIAGLNDIAPMLYKGRKGIEELQALQEKMRYTPADGLQAGVDRAAAFQMNIFKAKYGIDQLRTAIADKLIPVFSPLVDKFNTFVTDQDGMNKISNGIAKVFKPIVDSLVNADWDKIGQGIQSFIDGIKSAIKFVGGWENALIGLTVLLNARTIVAVAELAKSFFRLGVALLTTPIGWFLAEVAMVGLIAYEIYEHWDWFKKQFGAMWDWVVAKAEWGYKSLSDLVPHISIPGMGSSDTPGGHAPRVGDIPFDPNWSPPASTPYNSAVGTPALTPYSPVATGSGSPWDSSNNDDTSKHTLDITFANLPQGATTRMQSGGSLDINLRSQYAMSPAGP